MAERKRILVVDDEELARRRIARFVHAFSADLIIEEAISGLDAVERISNFNPDLIFLDVEMPGLNGFELLQQLEERPFQIIFQTAYDQFAIRAFEENACDYLLKPFTQARLHQALERALSRVAGEERLRALESHLTAQDRQKAFLRKLTVKQGKQLRLVEEREIICFISQDHYTCVYFGRGWEGICELSLARLLERLDPEVFQQLHRNNIVRIDSIVALSRSRSGEFLIELSNGMKLPVSRSHQGKAKRLIKSSPESGVRSPES